MLSIPIKDITAGDYCLDYGTVVSSESLGDKTTRLTFKNGIVIDQENETELAVDQGGLVNHSTYLQ